VSDQSCMKRGGGIGGGGGLRGTHNATSSTYNLISLITRYQEQCTEQEEEEEEGADAKEGDPHFYGFIRVPRLSWTNTLRSDEQ